MADSILGAGQESPQPAQDGQTADSESSSLYGPEGGAGEGEGQDGGQPGSEGDAQQGADGTGEQEGGDAGGDDKDGKGEGGDDSDASDESEESEGAPEQYEPFDLPEGFEIDDERNTQFVEFAKSHNLSQEAAQQAVDMATDLVQATHQQIQQAHAEQVNTWAQQAQQDQEYGGDQFDANVEVAQRAIDRFGGDELKQALKETGLGNHPELIRFAWKVGKAISEDSINPGGGSGSGPKDPADVLYGS